ncbi:MAG: hypothetical protein NVS9B10_03890 [Nevskia sp.]
MRNLIPLLSAAALIGAALLLPVADAPQGRLPIADLPVAEAAKKDDDGAVWAISFVRARPGQRERLERYLQSNWLALDELALRQQRITAYRMLRAEPDPRGTSWDFAVSIEYANRQAMIDFVPFYLELARGRPHLRVDGLDFPDLGEIVLQKTVTPLAYDAAHE